MSEAKPLHVQVAEALGCKPEYRADAAARARDIGSTYAGPPGEWYCTCEERHEGWDASGIETHSESLPPELSRYDTDWSATGPLIERYGVELRRTPLPSQRWAAVRERLVAQPAEYLDAFGDTPLVAVCRLILALKAEGKLNA